jgi:hypothetical protein
MLPEKKGRDTKLVLLGCYVHSIEGPSSAVSVQAGNLRAVGCTITNCIVGVDVFAGVGVEITSCNISFNGVGILMVRAAISALRRNGVAHEHWARPSGRWTLGDCAAAPPTKEATAFFYVLYLALD